MELKVIDGGRTKGFSKILNELQSIVAAGKLKSIAIVMLETDKVLSLMTHCDNLIEILGLLERGKALAQDEAFEDAFMEDPPEDPVA